MTTLREAAQQALEALEKYRQMMFAEAGCRWGGGDVAITALRAALAQEQAEPDISRCPQCNGPADNGFDRSFPPSPYLCTKCMAEPVQPVAKVELMTTGGNAGLATRIVEIEDHLRERLRPGQLLYTAPPQRTMVLLTEEEIKTAFHAAQNAKLGASQDNSRHRLSVIEIAHAVEQALWEKNK